MKVFRILGRVYTIFFVALIIYSVYAYIQGNSFGVVLSVPLAILFHVLGEISYNSYDLQVLKQKLIEKELKE